MANNQSKVQCPYCNVHFGFALPQKYIEKPHKNIKFSCAYCTEKFSIVVRDLFSDDDAEIASLKIRHQSEEGLQLYNDWEDLRLMNVGLEVLEQDPISAFGGEWKPAYLHSEIQNLFLDRTSDTQDDDLEPMLDEEENLFSDEDDDLFAEEPSDDPPWEESGMSDPFDIPVSNREDTAVSSLGYSEEKESDSDNNITDLIADGALEHLYEDSEPPVEAVVEEEISEDLFFAISDEVSQGGDTSIDALLSTLESGTSDTPTEIGTNTLSLLQSEEVNEATETTQVDEPKPSFFEEDSEESLESLEEEMESPSSVFDEDASIDDDLGNMKTVIDDSAAFLFEDSEEDLHIEPPHSLEVTAEVDESEEDIVLATATLVSDEDTGEESLLEETQTLGADASWVVDQPEKEDVLDNKTEPSPVSFFNPEDWVDDEDDDQEMPGSGSDSIDYDQTEEEESQSVLNPAFQVSTKKVVRKQYWAVVFVILFGVLSALMVSRYFSLEEVNKFFIPVDEQELLQNSSVVKKHEKKIEKAKESSEKLLREFQTENEEKPIEEKPIEEKSIPKEDLIAQKNQERTSPGKMNVVSPKKSVYLENKPLSEKRKKSSKTTRRSELQKLPPMDPKRATREGWIKIEDQSYDSAKRIFLNVIEEQPNPKAFMGVGFAEERLADRYKERKDFARVEQQYDAAHKYYCAAMDYYTEQESMNEEDRFGLMYLQARLKTISRGCS